MIPASLRRPVRVMAAFFKLAVAADRWRTLALVANEVAAQVAVLVSAYAIKLVVDAVVDGRSSALVVAAALMAGGAGVAALLGRNYVRSSIKLSEIIGAHVDAELMALSAGVSTIEHHEIPEYMDQMTLIRQSRQALGQVMNAAVLNLRMVVILVGAIAILAGVDPWLALLPAAIIPAAFANSRGATAIQRAQETNAPRQRLRQHLYQTATSPQAGKELRVFNLADTVAARHRTISETMINEADRATRTDLKLGLISSVVFAAGYGAAILLVLVRATDHQISLGDVVLVAGLALTLNAQLASVVTYGHYLQQVLKTVGRYLWLVDYATQHARPTGRTSPPFSLQTGISLRNVTFRYPGSKHDALTDINLDLPAGKVVALVGENGSGKTTLVKVLSAMYSPAHGSILIDDRELADIDPQQWSGRITAAFQDFMSFELLLQESVGIGDLHRVDDHNAVIEALTHAGAPELAGLPPDGLDTQLGRQWGGVDLSGGQWQKLALARSIIRQNPLLVVYDEPTAALDAETEHALYERTSAEARSPAAQGRVTVLISHRFSTVAMADHIVVLQSGRIAETGSHTQLIQQHGIYAELFQLQARAYQ